MPRARVLQGGFTLSSPPEPILRPQSSVSATSFAKVAAGDEQCFFRSWLKSNYRYEPLPSDFDRGGWATAHNLMLHKTKSELEQKGYTVFTENQNAFDAVGKTGAKFSGRADIVAVQGDTALIVDCKTGQYKAFHALQVRLYTYMLKHYQPDHPAHSCKTFLGQVLYRNGAVNELPPLATEVVFTLLKQYMPMLISDIAPAPTPSYSECRFCDIGKELCPERIETEPPASTTDIF